MVSLLSLFFFIVSRTTQAIKQAQMGISVLIINDTKAFLQLPHCPGPVWQDGCSCPAAHGVPGTVRPSLDNSNSTQDANKKSPKLQKYSSFRTGRPFRFWSDVEKDNFEERKIRDASSLL